jgi:predicted DNA-binding transcriptional regulator AlpA
VLNQYMTAQQVADTAGLKYHTLWMYRRRNTLPEPDLYLGNKPLWEKQTIDQWLATRRVRADRQKA